MSVRQQVLSRFGTGVGFLYVADLYMLRVRQQAIYVISLGIGECHKTLPICVEL